MKTPIIAAAAAVAALALSMPLGAFAQAQTSPTLTRIKERGHVICGTSPGVAGFSIQDAAGRWNGFDIDICRALAVAIFGDQDKAKFVPLTSKDRLIALQGGEIDVLPRTTTWTLSRNLGQGVTFTAVNYYDGQGFMVTKKLGVDSATKLDGASVCVAQGTTSELNLADYFRKLNMKYEVAAFTSEEALKAYESGRCDAYTTDISALSAVKLKLQDPDAHVILPEVISKEPLGPWVRTGDESWFNLVRWTVAALVNAEELGVTQANISEMTKSSNPEIKRFLGLDGKFGEAMGVGNDWVVRIIAAVGNYGESFERHLGMHSRLKLPRGPNALWTSGGLQYSPPFR
ncbi:amino acid ABC transporter substrate-binding protein [Bosea sp. Root381]|uniref:amino acid ABC transporter substrate-binding protein n=1 Tax=Bosea sp. Root381 TaxID=1736524 RepID=UPI0006F91C00|nr:amino acid ABC transporter substrate-binding protein [Bosea sp. Root381]KRE16855.1 amino acid ABC transporter substrate-binding protein [Bosea sp. Root381]